MGHDHHGAPALTPEEWIREHVEPTGPIEIAHEQPWATVLRVPIADGVAWFKACGVVQRFEPRLSSELSARWPDRVAEVLAADEERAWLLLADAGSPLIEVGNPPEAWLEALPLYAELQRGEVAHADDHLAHGVPDLRVEVLPERYEWFLEQPLPLEPDEIRRLRDFAPPFAELEPRASVQHDDLHHANLYGVRVLDWGDSSISHPFMSMIEVYRFLEGVNELPPTDPWFARLRDAYLEPWGGDDRIEEFELAMRLGEFAHSIAWARQRVHLPPDDQRDFDGWYPLVLRRALARIDG